MNFVISKEEAWKGFNEIIGRYYNQRYVAITFIDKTDLVEKKFSKLRFLNFDNTE